MSMEKKGVIEEDVTPPCGNCGCGKAQASTPLTKEGADQLQSHPVNDLIDAVATQTDKNR